jgi:hypothetical protein
VTVTRARQRRHRWWAAGAAVVLAGATSAVASASGSPGTPAQVTAVVAASTSITRVNSTVGAELASAPYDVADRIYKIPAICDTATTCLYGDVTGSSTIVLFGNSHARMWLPSIIPIATSDGDRILLLGKNECPVVSLNLNPTTYPDCNAVIAASIAVIKHVKPLVAILADRTVEPGYSAGAWEAGMKKTIAAISPTVGHVVVVGDIEQFNFQPDVCLSLHPNLVQKDCSIANPNPRVVSLSSAEKAAAKADNATYLNPIPWLCTTKRCSPIIGTDVVYWDNDHVSVTYAQYLSQVMGDALQPDLTAR